MTDMTLRIREIMRNNPDMTDAQIARKIGRDDAAGRERVAKERLDTGPEKADDGAFTRANSKCLCGGVYGTHSYCRPRKGGRR